MFLAKIKVNDVGRKTSIKLPDDLNMPALEDISIFDLSRDNEDVGAVVDMNNLDITIQVSHIPTTRIHKDHPLNQVIRNLQSATQTRNMSKNLEEHGTQKGNSCIEGSKLDRGYARRASTIQATRRIDYDEVFAPVARIEAIRLFLAYALFKDFMVYQMDVKIAFLYGKIKEEVYVCQPPRFEDPDFPDRVYKVEKHYMDYIKLLKPVQMYVDDIIFSLTKKELCNAFEKLMHEKFQMNSMGELTLFLGLQVQQQKKDVGVEADMNNLDTTIQVSHIPTTRIHKDHPLNQVIGDLQSATQTKNMSKNLEEHGKNPKRNKKDERGIVIRNKARLVIQGYTQEEGIDYDEVFALIARIKAIRLFLAYASFKDFVVYQMDVKIAFLYRKIEEEVYVCQPPGFEDPNFPDRVYKVEKALYGLHQAPKAWYETLSTYLLNNEFQRGKIDKTLFIKRHKGLQVQQKKDGIFISQDKYVGEILKKFRFTEVKTASTPMETQKPLLKDEDGEEVDVHMYRYQVNPKVSHLHVVKRIFRYLKGQPKLGLWYPKDSSCDLVAYIDSDYAGASLDRKSTTEGCQFLGSRLISWQCKKQTVVANSITEVNSGLLQVAGGHVLWIRINYLIMVTIAGLLTIAGGS
ncbi:putative ribonuclease H-like domain-containing protein [Tanacetum coccineum]